MLDYDIAILDIEMGELNGIDLASAINQRCPQCAVIFQATSLVLPVCKD